ncbi:MAG: hypothetical protein QOJ64_3448 [Acidobacteriota bacterium]|nr:hypothetical protein [Acidobacteriota bacterium]
MVTKHSQPKARYHLSIKLLITLLTLLVFADLARTQTGDQQIRVKIITFVGASPLGNVTVKIGPSEVKTDAGGVSLAIVPGGKHNVKASLQGYVVASMVSIPAPDPNSGGQAKSDEGDLEFSFPGRTTADENGWDYTLQIYLKHGGSLPGGEKEIGLAAVSEDCKDFDWEGSSIKFGSEFRLNKYGLAHGKTVLEPGEYKVSFHHPNLDPRAIGDKFIGLARISRVEVYRPFPKQEMVGTYPADENGVATVPLDAGLWRDNNVPYIKVYVEKLCDLRFATVEFFQGQVEVTEQFDSLPTEPRPAESGMNLFKNDTIKLSPGSSIQLKSQGGIYQINISVPQSGVTAQLNIGAFITAEGRKFIGLLTESTTRIEIKRLLVSKPSQPPPAPNVPPVWDPGPGPVIVTTSTVKVTHKQTNYMVSYDATTGVTTVAVEEGEVEVTPTNTSLQPFTLAANQQVQVTDRSVGAITSYSGAGSHTGRILLYIGIGLASMLILAALFYFFRRHHRLAMQPAYDPGGVNNGGWNPPSVNVAPGVNQGSQRCRNPQCGKESPAGNEVCRHCGALLMQK